MRPVFCMLTLPLILVSLCGCQGKGGGAAGGEARAASAVSASAAPAPGVAAAEYRRFLGTLDAKDLNAIGQALAEAKNRQNGGLADSDAVFRAFRDFYRRVIAANSDDFGEGKLNMSDAVLRRNGLQRNGSEAGDFLGEVPDFLYANFHDSVSDGLKEYLRITRKESEECRGTYFIEDAGLMISWDQLADRIVAWEKFRQHYPDCPEECKEGLGSVNLYLELYLASCLDNTLLFQDRALVPEARASYERFLSRYKDSRYAGLVRGYYDILKKNAFTLTGEAVAYLQKQNIDTEMLQHVLSPPGGD